MRPAIRLSTRIRTCLSRWPTRRCRSRRSWLSFERASITRRMKASKNHDRNERVREIIAAVTLSSADRWPALPYDAFKDTHATLHMWTQIVGKIALALAPPLNHSWAIAFLLTPRGFSTRRLVHGDRSFAIEFDFVHHELVIRTSDGVKRTIRLAPRSVADFYREVMATLREMKLEVKIWPMPVELAVPIRFETDTLHASYDRELANRFWRIVVQAEEVLTQERCTFIGKCSPAHFFWGGFDLALSRFSGRPAPPREGPAFMREAYSHEVISHGFWPGGGPVLEPIFYGYAAPEPNGLKEAPVQPA